MKQQKRRQASRRKERGFALLEYCAGATIILVVVWASVQAMGVNVGDMVSAIGEWASQRATEIRGSGQS